MSIPDKLAQLQALPAEKQSFIGTALGALGGAVTGLESEKMSTQKQSDLTGALGGAGVYGALGGLVGAPVGGLYGMISGAYQGGKGKRLRGALRGAGRGIVGGGLIGAGAGAGFGGVAGAGIPMAEIIKATKDLPAADAARVGARIGAGAAEAHGPVVHNLMRAGTVAGLGAGGYFGHKAFKGVAGDFHKKPKQQQTEDTKMSTQKKAAWPEAIENANSWLQRTLNSGENPLNVNYHNVAAIGAGIGGLGGALTAPKGKMLKRTLQGVGLGALGGLGAGIGGQLGSNMAHGTNAHAGGHRLLTGLGAFGGGMLAHTLADRALNEFTDDTETGDHKRQEQQEKDEEEMRIGLSKISRQQKAANIMQNPMAQGALMGGAGSALAGGLAGLVAPGYEDTVDEYGNPVRKQRNRFGAAMRGALGAGALGAAGGAAAGHFAPEMVSQGMNHLRNFGENAALLYRGESLPRGGHKGLHPSGGRAPLDAVELPRTPPRTGVA